MFYGTPGPWTADRHPTHWSITGRGDVSIASTPVRHIAGRRIENRPPTAEDDANAALIAAAPELLETLRGLTAPNNSPETYDAAFKAALAAIAKAEGRS